MGLLQVYLHVAINHLSLDLITSNRYFFWYGKDARVLKIAVGPLLRTNFGELTAIPQVIIVVFLESFQLATLFASTYHYLIDGFGNFPQLLEIYWL
ncbi:hypothetical protein B0H13DRAFT_2369049 [Mycena leptocephala]|nr:hypothetical protein B0H13DRAFT_2369049 [Mycena leptocephala]